ncbi:DNA repair exonuclease [archaeon]|nr:DNA repair exonuclease [archaeon]
MKIALISDLHLGFGKGERIKDSFTQALQALELALQSKAELIILSGDLFDDSVPSTETWHDAFSLFEELKPERQNGVKALIEVFGQQGIKADEFSLNQVPIIAIHGTHEFRGKDFRNALEVLKASNNIIYIHAMKAIVSINSEKIAVSGLGGVPEKKALEVLQLWNPKPEKGLQNLLVLHQSLKEFLPFDDEMVASLSLEDLPKGFQFIVNGHLHWHKEMQLGKEQLLVLPGSTVITQMKKIEAGQRKGFYLLDSSSGRLGFIELPLQRKLFYHKVSFKDAKPEEVLAESRAFIESCLQENRQELKPLIRLKLSGSLSKGFHSSDLVNLSGLIDEFRDKAVISVDKDFTSIDFKEKIIELRKLQEKKLSVLEMGLELLEKNFKALNPGSGIDSSQLFELLAGDKIDEAIELLGKAKN